MNSIKNTVKNIAWICKPFWKYGKLYIILSVCISAIYTPIDDLIYVWFPEIIINMLNAGRAFSAIAVVAALICGASFLNNAVRMLARAYFNKRKAGVEVQANQEIYRKAMKLDYRYIDSPEYYDNYAWAVDEYSNQMEAARQLLIDFFQCVLSLVVLVSIIATLGPWILLAEILEMFLISRINVLANKMQIREKDGLVPVERRLGYFHRLFYMKDYAADVKSTPLGEEILAEHRKTGEKKVKVVGSYAWKIEMLYNCQELVFSVTELIVVLYIVRSIISGRIAEVGMYMTLMLSFYRLDTRIHNLTFVLSDANVLSMNVEKIRNFFNMKSEIEVQDEAKAKPETGNFSVELKDVGFSYENSEFSLSGLNLKINPGEKIAIVGENGAGKSTFVKLLLRLYDVKDGEILINGKSIKDYDIHALRQQIGVAFQNTNIYAMSLADNISLYGNISEKSMIETAEKLGLDEVTKKNKTDYNAELTREFYEDGILLSSGEAQKVALARVMSRDFSLLLLDEPSSALDPIAEYKMSEAILSAANKATTIIIAHRLSTIRDADKIYVFDHGKIVESGTHDELMDMGGHYCEMFTKQAENYVRE